MVSNSYFMNQCPLSTNWLNPKPTAYWDSTIGAPTLVDGAISSQPDVQADGRENRFTYSNDVSQVAWVAVSATKVNATTFTPTAINGQLYQLVNTTSGVTYTLTAEAKVASGTRTLRLFTTYGSGGDAVVGTDWTPLTYTVLANTTAATGWGIGDPAGSGWVSVEVRNLQMRVSTTSSTYVATTTTPIYAAGYPATQGTAANRPYLSGASGDENRVVYSDLSVYTSTYWANSRSTWEATTISKGGQTLRFLKEDATAANTHLGAQGTAGQILNTVSGRTYKVRFIAYSTNRYISLRLTNGVVAADYVTFNLSTGVIEELGAAFSNAVATSNGDGSFTCTVDVTATASTLTAYLAFYLTDTTARSYNGDNTSGAYIGDVNFRLSTTSLLTTPTTTFPIYAGINGNRVPVFDGSNDSLTTSPGC
jgi:hypothetical protein